MAQEEGGSLPEVRARVRAAHGIPDLAQNLHFYDRWAPDYEQDVATLQYHAPRLAVDCLTQALPGPPHSALILDVACGTGLVAAECWDYRHEPLCLVLLQECREERHFRDQVRNPRGAHPKAERRGAEHENEEALAGCRTGNHRGGLVCLTTRTNSSNLQYKEALEATLDRMEQAGTWEGLVAWPVDRWELATSELEVVSGISAKDGFISGIVYLYRKRKATQVEEVRSSPQPPAGP
uniref:Methyltransferase like 27 n=1 Tax=Pan troglodytes TaxID=9598 RepID=A0A2I3TWM1_PANTR